MIKFLFFFLLCVPLFFVGCYYFWVGIILLILIGLFFLIKNLLFLNGVYIYSFVYIDALSFGLIFLSIWITVLIIYSRTLIFNFKLNRNYFSFCVVILCLFLFITFFSCSLLNFYFYFEISLIPTLIIIIGWGYQPERLQAGIYFLFYTLSASLPLLFVLINLFFSWGTLDFLNLRVISYNRFSILIFLGLTLAFLVKIPIFFTHLWLPKAHVEAPVSGSMILAGVLLKLGGYGFYRVIIFCLGGLKIFSNYFFGLRIIGILYVGFICCRLNDLKALVAYFSVAHIALVICGFFRLYVWGVRGGYIIIIRHGLASSGLFCVVNIYYERTGSRRIFLNKGLIIILPLLSLFLFLLRAANMAAPPTLNLISEIFLIIRILKFDFSMLLIFPLASYIGAVFTLFMFSLSQHGKSYKGSYSYLDSVVREYHLLVLHILPINFLILKPEYFLFIF